MATLRRPKKRSLVNNCPAVFYFGSLDVTQVVKKNVNPQTGLPNVVSGIPPTSDSSSI